MNIRTIALLLISFIFGNKASLTADVAEYTTQWLVIGAGPAGITVTGLLLDMGFSSTDIVWIDPDFNVGRLGAYYQNVPGNTKTKLYIDYLKSCRAFAACQGPSWQKLQNYDPEAECPLYYVIEPLQEITHHLLTLVTPIKGMLTSLYADENNYWHAHTQNGAHITARSVILATGSHPRGLDYAVEQEIPLDTALDQHALKAIITKDDTIAVVGSAHSAILVMKFLHDAECQRIINFYQKPLSYTYVHNDLVYHSHDGLKGVAAAWAHNVLENERPPHILRFKNTEKARAAWLPICTKIIYAIGYERNEIPASGVDFSSYNTQTGQIAPGLFGIGIAFPEVVSDPSGVQQHRVGLNSFMNFALRQLPGWASSTMNNKQRWLTSQKFAALFDIVLL